MVFLSYLFRREKRFKKLTVETLFLLALGLVGFAFVVVSQVEEIGGIDGITPPTLMLGVALGLGSAIVGALAVYSFKWGFDLATDIEENQLVQKENRESRSSLELFGVVVVCIISTWISSFFSAFAGFFNNETLDFRTVLIGILLGGFTISVASICWRKAISVTSDLGINGMIYLTPVVALIWLGVFSRIDVPYPEYLLIGASGIIIANLLINIEIEVRVGFKSMLIGLWICGLVVYSRGDPIVWEHGYFEILALSATIFTLILSFRVSRMESRTGEEEKEIFAMFRRMELLVESGVLSEELLGNMQDIDSPRNTERLRDVYVKMKREIIEVRANTSNGPNRTELAEVEASLDSIVHSKQQGTEFGELFSLIIFAIITVVIALVAVPDVTGWTRVLVDLFAILFSSVILCLTFNILDLYIDRSGRVLRKQAEYPGYGVVFRDARNRIVEFSIAVVFGFAIVFIFGYLLWSKWT